MARFEPIHRRIASMAHELAGWAVGFALILALHIVWLMIDRTPPAWDMAYHQELGWRVLRLWQEGEFWSRLPSLSPYYPPLYYLQEAAILHWLGETRLFELLSNLPGLFLLSLSTWALGRRWLTPAEAMCAGWIVVALPMVGWTSRESLLDLTLAGWVALALYLIVRSRNLTHSGSCWLLGVVMAAGFLTKWTFPLFVAPPLVFALARSPNRERSFRNLLKTVLVALPPCLYWLLPNIGYLVGERMTATVQQNVARQAPAVLSVQSLLYYPRSLLGYYLFLPLGAVFAAAVFRRKQLAHLALPAVSLASSVVLLSALYLKDPRYLMPLAAPLALIVAATAGSFGRLALVGVTATAAVQLLWVSFTLPLTPPRMALAGRSPDPDYLNLTYEWVFFTADYYGVMGPPRQQPWPFAALVGEVEPWSRVGFVPEQATCHVGLISLESARTGLALSPFRVGETSRWEEELERTDYVVGKTGAQGISYLTAFSSEVYSALERREWPLVKEWDLPDGTELRLWRNPTPSR